MNQSLNRSSKLKVLPKEAYAAKRLMQLPKHAVNVNKFDLFTNHFSHKTYSFIVNAATCQEARNSLTNTYEKQKDIAFARHLLTTEAQSPTKIIGKFIHALRQLARDCEFQNVNAENYENKMISDGFIKNYLLFILVKHPNDY